MLYRGPCLNSQRLSNVLTQYGATSEIAGEPEDQEDDQHQPEEAAAVAGVFT
jgi:hypothetical protein